MDLSNCDNFSDDLKQQVLAMLPPLNIDEDFHARRFLSKLSTKDKEELDNLSREYRNQEKPHFYAQQRYSFFFDRVAPNINVSIFNAFVFTEKLSPNSTIQEKAFASFQGRSLDCLFQRSLNEWNLIGNSGIFNQRVPEAFRGLIFNRGFRLNYAIPFLIHPVVEKANKNSLIWKVAVALQDEKTNKFLTTAEVELLFNLREEFDLNLSPIIPSIRHFYNLEGVPDEWIRETFL
jgi:hypothetical protein